MQPASPHSETAQQLERLRAQVEQDNPQLYRHWALYLQVLRDGLATAVERACFHLAVAVHPQRYRALADGKRQGLHRRMTALVQRSCTLLTIEQLQALSAQMQRRRRREGMRAQRQWLQDLQSGESRASAREAAEVSSEPPVDGSVHLGLALPISTNLFGMEQPDPSWAAVAQPEASDQPISDQQDADLQVSALEGSDHPAADLLAVFTRLLEDAERDAADSRPSADPDDRLLPSDPQVLVHWFDDLDAALARRLRNLSHALNVELVRLGLSGSLMPLRLLEAVAAGQIDSQAAAANLVRLSLPIPDAGGGRLVETQALLIRASDLEAEQPRLRTCRTRLQQARQELRRMAQTYQRLERRLQALEAEQLWLNDHSTAKSSRTPPLS